MQQTTSKIAMIRPAAFGFNIQTAASNHYQVKEDSDPQTIQQQALKEFDHVVESLKAKDIEVLVLEDDETPPKPDAIFPNNWFACKKGLLEIYPLYAENRRLEKRSELTNQIQQFTGIDSIKDYSNYEQERKFLEGTGSMVFDHVNNNVYACTSERTSPELLEIYCAERGLRPVLFNAFDENGKPIYHTNVMLSIGENFAVICIDAIHDRSERTKVTETLHHSSHEIISISKEQVKQFCGNILELKGRNGKRYIVMSDSAFNGFGISQRERLGQFGEIIHFPIPTIERIGGGSMRCMIAELFC